MGGIGQFEYPVWLQVICWIVIGFFVIFIVYGIYVNCLKSVFNKRRVVKARLVSKVKEDYREIKVYNSRGAGIKSPSGPLKMAKDGIAYRLYFDVNGKTIELDVTKEIFDSLKEDTTGMLDYQGNFYYDFKI